MQMLTIQLLGNFHLSYGAEQSISIVNPRQRNLVAYLLLHRDSSQLRQQIAFALWPDSSEPQAYNNLRKNLYLLRQTLPKVDHFLHIDNRSIRWRLSAPYMLDVAAFEAELSKCEPQVIGGQKSNENVELRAHLEAAVDLYQGDLLPDCYDEWIVHHRERLRNQFVAALFRLLACLEQLREYPAAIGYAQQLLRYDPLSEIAHQHLMRLYLLSGDRSSALNAYNNCVATLQAELGVEPSATTIALYQQLRHQQLPLASPLERAPPSLLSNQTHNTLVGRHKEWQQLLETWKSVANGHTQFVLIRGEAGIGKTRLTEELLTWAGRQGVAVAYTRSYAAEGALAYAPITEWLRNPVLKTHLPSLDDVWLSELSRLLPELAVEMPHLLPPTPLTESWQRKRLFEALVRAICMIFRQPEYQSQNHTPQAGLLLVIDDLQWSDRETLEWLHFLLRYDPHAPLLVVGTVRSEEISNDHPLNALLLGLHQLEQIREIELVLLNYTESTALAVQVADKPFDEKIAAHLYQTTEGIPLFIVEAIRSMDRNEVYEFDQASDSQSVSLSSLPPKVYAIIQHRLGQLSPSARNITLLAAVIGRSFSFRVLAEASELTEETLVRSLDELWQRRIVHDLGEETYDFTHDRIREVVYAQTGPARRRLLHKRVALALEAISSDQTDNISGQLGYHRAQAQQWAEALCHYQRAADVSAKINALDDVIFNLEKVLIMLNHLPHAQEYVAWRIDCWLTMAHVFIGIHGWTATERKAALDLAYEWSTEYKDDERQLRVLRALAGYYCNFGDSHETHRLSQETLTRTQRIQDAHLLYIAYHQIGYSSLYRGELLSSLTYFQSSIPFESAVVDDWLEIISRRSVMAQTLWLCGYPVQSHAMAVSAIQIADEQGMPFGRIHGREFMMCTAQRAGDTSMMQKLANEITELCVDFSYPDYAISAQILMGWFIVETDGDDIRNVETGLAKIQDGLNRLDQMNAGFIIPYFLSVLAYIQGKSGQVDEALATLKRAYTLGERSGDLHWKAEILRLTGELRLQANHDIADVECLYKTAIEVAQEQGSKMLELRATVSLASLWQAQGQYAEAHRMLAEIYGWFTEGFESVDLQAAKSLLDIFEAP